jgi:hypothetical protein
MGEILDHPYKRVPRQIVERLIRAGYLANSERHKLTAVTRAWDRFKRDVDRLIAARNCPGSAK